MTTTTDTAATPSPVATLPDQDRASIVVRLLDEIWLGRLDNGTAALMLDVLGMTGNTDHIAHGLAARYMREGLADGSIRPRDVEPQMKISNDLAVQVLVGEYQRDIDESVAALATVREATS